VFELPLDLPCLPVLRALELRIFLGFSGPGLPPHLYPVVAALPTTVPMIEVLWLTFYGALLMKRIGGPTAPGLSPCSTTPVPIAQNFHLCAGCIATGSQMAPSIKRTMPPSMCLSSKDSLDCGALASSRFLLVVTRAHLD
jgi:hypothetical protein